jgi:hypothetical protein
VILETILLNNGHPLIGFLLLSLTLLREMAKVAIEDLSGHTTPVTGNPYDGLISATNNDSVRLITALYCRF